MLRYVRNEFLYGNYGTLDLYSQRLFQWRGMERVSGCKDAGRDVKFGSHRDNGSTAREVYLS